MTLRPHAMRAASVSGAAFLALSLAVSGCSHKYSSDEASLDGTGAASELLAPRTTGGGLDFRRGRAFYPLAVGNHWDYHVRTVSQVFTDAGPQPPQVDESPFAIEIIGTESYGERVYFLEKEFDPRGPVFSGAVFRVRQDRLGMYDLDAIRTQAGIAVDEAPADPAGSDLVAYVDRTVSDPGKRAAFHRAAVDVAARVAFARPILRGQRPLPNTGAQPGEITLLSYPIYVGARWVVRDGPRFARIVEARERVGLPLGTLAAWKIRGTAELFGPQDRVYFWYSNLGLLRMHYTIVSDAVDDTGNVIGRVVQEQDQALTDIHLVGRGAALAGAQEP